jgi:peptidoglycan/LPS O-acetylase OafA/YrhL
MTRAGIVYQPALDGVRAISVLAVLAFHAELAGFSGGYLGVSVFFTLSGFLITSLLIAEHDRHRRIDVGAFYVRRAKRLLPASVVCLVAISVLAATTDLFAGVADLRRDLLGSLFQVANWVFLAGEGSYQQLFADAAGQSSPLEHYWSLAIEEQFYWLWPLAFLGICRVATSHRSRTWVIACATAFLAVAAPVIAAIWGVDAAYWATPARAAEILVGALTAFLLSGRVLAPRWAALAPGALVALAVAVVTFPASGGPAYHGALPLVGIVSAALIVGLQVPGLLRAALSLPPMVWLGRISYGVYLFHWPVYVIIDTPRVDLDRTLLTLLRLAVTLALAQLSMILVEAPIRNGIAWRPRPAAFAALGATALVAAVAAVLVPNRSAEYWRDVAAAEAAAIQPVTNESLAPLVATTESTPTASTATPPTSTLSPTSASTTTTGIDTVSPTSSVSAALPTLTRPVRIVVAGDSTAEATGFGLAKWALERPDLAQVSIRAEKGCGFVRGGEQLVQEWVAIDPRCDRWLDSDLVGEVTALQTDVVMLMTTSWDVLDRRWTADDTLTPLDAEFATRINDDFLLITQRLLDAGAAHVVWVREPVPNVFWWNSGQAQEDPARHDVLYAAMDAIATARPGQVSVVDLPAWLAGQGLDTDQEARPDGVHWSPEAAARIARDFLGEALIRAALDL